MTKQINRDKLRALEATSNAIAMRTCVFIENTVRGTWSDATPVRLGVNWSSCGTKPAAYAAAFAANVTKAAAICDYVNDRYFVAVYGEKAFNSKEEYDDACEQLAEWLEEGDAEAIVEWLEA